MPPQALNSADTCISSTTNETTYCEELAAQHELLLLDMASIELEKLRHYLESVRGQLHTSLQHV